MSIDPTFQFHPEDCIQEFGNESFPFKEMYEFAHIIKSADNRINTPGYRIYSVHFDCLSATNSTRSDMFAVRMHCQIKRFEEFVDRYGATITRLHDCDAQQLHVDAVVKNDALGWFEIATIYHREDLVQVKNSMFEDIDRLRDLFMLKASAKDWKVSDDALAEA